MIALRVAPLGSLNSEMIASALVAGVSAVDAAVEAAAAVSFAMPGSAYFGRLPASDCFAIRSSPF